MRFTPPAGVVGALDLPRRAEPGLAARPRIPRMHEPPGPLPPPSGRGPAPWAPLSAASGERLAGLALRVCAALPVLLSVGLVVVLARGSWSAAERLAQASGGVGPAVEGMLAAAGLAEVLAVPVGLLSAIVLAVPLGVGVALYLEGPRTKLRALLAFDVASLAAVPSLLYGLVGLELFVRALHRGHGMIEAALVLALVMLPIVTVAARAALRAVPEELREAGCALGATPWQVTQQVVMPAARPRLRSGAILAIGRAFGEAAALLLLAGLALPARPVALGEPLDVLPLHVLALVVDPGAASHAGAWVGVLVLLCTLAVLSGWAMVLRHRHERRP
jgi:phosphate transport system permease protein